MQVRFIDVGRPKPKVEHFKFDIHFTCSINVEIFV